jgi:hypothetical protein
MNDPVQQASDLIVTCCAHVSAFEGSGEAHQLLMDTAAEMRQSRPSAAFPQRYIEHVAYALDTVARFGFLSPQAAIASVYLATRFEFYFRILSGRLTREGTWVSAVAQREAIDAIGDQRLKRAKVSSVARAYRVMKLNTGRVSTQCRTLDAALYPKPVTLGSGFIVSDLGDRIEFGRNEASHGARGDISAESVFYGLMTAIVFYGHESRTAGVSA